MVCSKSKVPHTPPDSLAQELLLETRGRRTEFRNSVELLWSSFHPAKIRIFLDSGFGPMSSQMQDQDPGTHPPSVGGSLWSFKPLVLKSLRMISPANPLSPRPDVTSAQVLRHRPSSCSEPTPQDGWQDPESMKGERAVVKRKKGTQHK